MPNNDLRLKKYAELIVKTGANVQEDQLVVVSAPVSAVKLVREITKAAFERKAKEIIYNWSDPYITRENYLNVREEVLADIPEWAVKKSDFIVDNGACMISVTSPVLGINEGVDPKKLAAMAKASNEKLYRQRDYLMANHGQWTIAGYPNYEWASKVFPDLNKEEAYEKLLDSILSASRAKGDFLENWDTHNRDLKKYNDILTKYDFDTLHFKNSIGTDIKIGLADKHIWAGGEDVSSKGIRFNPNLPTEENFTMPHKDKVNGKVVATMPLDFQGKLIKDFYLIFKDGRVVDFDAKAEKEALYSLLNYDDGASRIGEIALIPYDSPISRSKILYYNTLFDENASCHMALGRAYPTNTLFGDSLSEEELAARGYNKSMVHVDFMFGSEDLDITGITKDGKMVQIFKNGNYCF